MDTHLTEGEDAQHQPRSGRKPEGASKEQVERTLARNRALLRGEDEPGEEGEESIAGGKTVSNEGATSGASRGDYSND